MPQELNDAWDNRKAFENRDSWYASCHERSQAFAASADFSLDHTYGPKPRNRIDVLKGNPAMPTLFHIHGGYWQWNDKEDYWCAGEAAHGQGLNIAVVEHTLAPEASIAEIVAEIRAGLEWYRANRESFGITCSDIIVSGHSSGGHLASLCQGEEDVIGTVLVSGIYDLRPITKIYVNDVVGMDADTAEHYSPALRPRNYGNFAIIAFGAEELETFRYQSRAYHGLLSDTGMKADLVEVPGRNHFDVLDELMDEDGTILNALTHMLGSG